MEHPFVTVEGLQKRYRGIIALHGISFQVGHGEVFALLGPNGAGKTTLVRILMGIAAADSGSVRWNGRAKGPGPAEIGYLPEERGLYADQPVLRTLVYLGALRGLSRTGARSASIAWLDRAGLLDRAAAKVESLSKGNQQKVQFIAAVLHRPRFLVLDEPFSGLDPVNQNLFSGWIRELRNAGTTVLLSAHQMALVEQLAERMCLLSRGERVLYGSLPELKRAATSGRVLRVEFSDRGFDSSRLADLIWVRAVRVAGRGIADLELNPGADLGPILRWLGDHAAPRRVESRERTLHDLYVEAVGRHEADAPPGGDEAWH